jgi:hypothetical protein
MGASKRLKNHANLRGTPTSAQGGNGPRQQKRGLKGDMGAGGRFSAKDGTEITGVTQVATGDAGVQGGNTYVGRGSHAIGDARSVLDSDLNPLGTDSENAALATFSVATGNNGAGTFEVTGANTGNIMQVSVYARGTDTDTDGDLLGVFYVAADGTAKVITLTAVGYTVGGDVVAVYGREMDSTVEATARSAGVAFGTRRTVTTDVA